MAVCCGDVYNRESESNTPATDGTKDLARLLMAGVIRTKEMLVVDRPRAVYSTLRRQPRALAYEMLLSAPMGD